MVCAGCAYAGIGVGTAALAGATSSSAAVKSWRLVAWAVSLAIFIIHVAVEHTQWRRRVSSALHVAVAVALGAFGVALLGPVRSQWGEPQLMRVATLSLVVWPFLGESPLSVQFKSGDVRFPQRSMQTNTTDALPTGHRVEAVRARQRLACLLSMRPAEHRSHDRILHRLTRSRPIIGRAALSSFRTRGVRQCDSAASMNQGSTRR
jgi:hypothetical protein